MTNILSKISTWKFILPTFVATAFLLYRFQIGQNEMIEIAQEEVTLIDLMQSYTVAEVQALFTKLKPAGRAIHQQLTAKEDMLFPFAYGPFFILVLAFFAKNIFGRNSKLLYLSFLPVLTMTFDYMENFNTLTMLDQFPALVEETVNRGSMLTSLKHVFSVATYVLALVGLVIYLIRTVGFSRQ